MMEQEQVPDPVNFGNPGEISMLELAKRVIGLTASRSRIAFAPLQEDDPRQREPDISLAKATLGWQSVVSLEDGLRETIDYFH